MKEELLLTSRDDRADPLSYTQRIVDLYVAADAAHSINVSSVQRDRALEAAARAVAERRASPAAFDETQKEALHVLRDDAYPRFVKSALTHNLGNGVGTFRKRMGLVLLALTLAGTVACIALVNDVPAPALAAFFPAWFGAVDMLVSAKTHVCVRAAVLGWGATAVGASFEVKCPITRRTHRKYAEVQFLWELLIAAVVTGVAVGVAFGVRS